MRKEKKFKVLDLKTFEDLIFNQAKMSEVDDVNRNVLY